MLILRRIGAVLTGLIIVVALSTGTDQLLESSILPGLAKAQATTGVWLFVAAYSTWAASVSEKAFRRSRA